MARTARNKYIYAPVWFLNSNPLDPSDERRTWSAPNRLQVEIWANFQGVFILSKSVFVFRVNRVDETYVYLSNREAAFPYHIAIRRSDADRLKLQYEPGKNNATETGG